VPARRRSEAGGGWLDRLAVLSDLGRLRLLRLVELEELGVGELARALQWPQSTVSRQLKPLLEAGWLRRRVEGTTAYYRFDPADLDDAEQELWRKTLERISAEDDATALEEDDRRMREVIAARRTDTRSYFGRIGGEWDAVRRDLFGDHFFDEALLGLLPPNWTVADLGCGTGEIAERLATVVRRVIAVDRESAMIEAARRRLETHPTAEVRKGDLEDLPIEDGELDAAVLSLVLHHLETPGPAFAEATRVLRPGGVLLVIDMIAHDREGYRAAMGHVHLGFDEPTLAGWAEDSGLRLAAWRRLRPDPRGRGPGLFAATYEKPPTRRGPREG
jgi:SAM-dependent methyltransferase/DNA-binding MarR family transcriptional regulator